MIETSPEPLLRERAVTHKMLGPQSVPVIAIASHLRLQLVFWLILLLAAVYLLLQTNYRETVAAPGVLEPGLGMRKIISPATAQVEKVHVVLGEYVTEGSVLATLKRELHDEAGRSLHRQTVAQLSVERELLGEQLRNQQQALEQSRRWSELAVAHARSNRHGLEQEAALLAEQLEMSERSLRAVTKLFDAGNSSVREHDQQRRVHLELRGQEQALAQKILRNEQELDALANAQRVAEFEHRQSIYRLRREMQLIEQQISAADNQALFTIVAESSGTVAELGLEPGKPVLVNQPLFYINPADAQLQATIYVPAAIQAKLAVGQSVLLRYDAFDYRQYGRQGASIVAVGKARLDPRESLLTVAGINEPVFKVTAALHDATVGGESGYTLLPGSTLIADFVLTEQSLLRFIFNPILGLRGKLA